MPSTKPANDPGDGPSQETSAARLFPLSAGSSAELLDRAQGYVDWLEGSAGRGVPLADLCHAAGSRQGSDSHRLAIAFQTREELAQRLKAHVRGEARARAWSGQAKTDCANRIAFVFCGQGAQWWGMGRRLIETEPRFRSTIEECHRAISALASWSLLEELLADESRSRLSQTEVAQPALVALQIALTRLWASFGVQPSAVIGHSVGEIAAAHAAGVLSLEEAMRLAYHRGRIMQRATGRGRMAAVTLSSAHAAEAIRGLEGRVSIAACNSPFSTVLAGDTEPLEELLKTLEGRGISVRKLRVDYAFHSHQMEPLLDDLEAALGRMSARPPSLPIVSTVTGTRLGRREGDFGPRYWRKNVRQPVLFQQALTALIGEGFRTFVEIGPHPVLWIDINHALEQAGVDGTAVSSLQREEDDRERLLSSLGRLYVLGVEPRWKAVYPEAGAAELPEIAGPSRAANDPLAGWFYEEHWTARPRRASDWVPELFESFGAGRWLVFEDAAGVGEGLRAAIGSIRQHCVRVSPGPGYSKLGEEQYQVDPSDPADLRRLLAEMTGDPRRRCARVVYLWGLDAREVGSPESRRAAQGLLHLMQELARAGLRDAPPLWIVTRGGQAALGDEPRAPVSQAWLWGLARVAMHEHPNLRSALIDLELAAGSNEARILCGVIAHEDMENQLAVRSKGVMIPRLRPSRGPAGGAAGSAFREDGTYVVAGGLGALGLRVAHWMAAQGVRRIWTLDRQEPSAEALKSLELARAAGAQVTTMRADLRELEDVQRVLGLARASGGPVRGIIDCARTFEEESLLSLSAAGLQAALEEDGLAAWNLHLASQASPLDFFVLFSSVFSLLGASGQAASAAAGALRDSLAQQRRRQGLPAVSVRWAPWSGVGPDGGFGSRSVQGLPKLDPASALHALERLIRPGAPAVATVMPFNARQWRQSSPALANLPLVAELYENEGRTAGTARSIRAKIESVHVAARADLLRSHLRQTVADVIGRPISTITLDSPLDRLGLTSLKAVELRNQLEDSLGLRLPATLAWGGHATVNHFVLHLAERLSIPLEEAPRLEGDDAIMKRLFETLSQVQD